MQLLYRNSEHMFDIFEDGGNTFITATAGTVAMYEVTMCLTAEEVERALANEAYGVELARRLAYNPKDFADRLVEPAISPP